MGRLVRSLRFRLAALGFAAIVAPLGVLSFVTAVTDTDAVLIGAEVDTETETGPGLPGTEITTETVGLGGVSPWAWLTVLVLAAVAAPLCWWAAGRLVSPIDAIRAAAERVELTGLDRRVSLAGGSDELIRLGAAFDDMLGRLEASATTERRRLAETSHDLRTPLAAIRSTAEVLATDPDPTIERLRSGHDQIAEIAARLTSTVDDLLVTARRDQYRWSDPFDLLPLVDATVAEAASEAERRHVDVVIESSGPVEVATDRAALRRATANLLDNAIRHADRRVTVRTESADGVVRLVVSNDGDRLPDGAFPFEPYWTGDEAGGRVGLGLAIVAQVAEANGGTVSARSLPGLDGGAEFTLELPAR